MMRIAHITDLHFGAEDPAVVAALAAEITDDAPNLVAISGDLTLGARRAEFEAARAFFDAIPVPWLAVPGNHDITPYRLLERFTDPYARWRKVIGPETEPVWQNDQVMVVGLNTARRVGLHWDWSRGRVTAVRLQRVLARLSAAPRELTRIVVAHHPLLPPESAPLTPVVGGAGRALSALASAGVRLVLAGHLHRGYARLASPAPDAPLILQGSTATSTRLRGEPNAYNRVTIAADGRPSVEVRVWNGGAWETQRRSAATPAVPDDQRGLSARR